MLKEPFDMYEPEEEPFSEEQSLMDQFEIDEYEALQNEAN